MAPRNPLRSKRSKKEEARLVLQDIYDGSKKSYPRGDMLFFIPVMSKLDNEYTAEQQDKFITNHEAYLGDEDCTAKLQDWNTKVELTNGNSISIRSLLKSIPSLPGISLACF